MQRDARIDGWRGVSVLLVILGHLLEFRFHAFTETDKLRAMLDQHTLTALTLAKYLLFKFVAPLQMVGVEIFFIISGYLITTLLMREEAERGTVSFSAFYVRRICRIFPAFYLFMATVLLLLGAGVIGLPLQTWTVAAAFLFDLLPDWNSWWVGHSWSLAVEEQFYLVWPLAFVLLGARRRAGGLAIILAGLLLLSLVHFMALSFAHIAMGALVAASTTVRRRLEHLASWPSIVAATALVVLLPVLIDHAWLYALYGCVIPPALALVFFGTLHGKGPYVPLVSLTWLQHLGVVSYSVYLWQQLWTGKPELMGSAAVFYLPLLLIIPALLSYRFVERPMIRLGHRLSGAILRQSPAVSP